MAGRLLIIGLDAGTFDILDPLVASGDIYLGKYAGWYSVRDETYFVEGETEVGQDGKRRAIPTGAEVSWVEEPSYFFKLSAWADRLLEGLPGAGDDDTTVLAIRLPG